KQDNDWLERHFVNEAENIMNTYKETSKEDINKVAKKMIEADYIWLGGWRMTMAVTSYMQFVLKYMLGNSSMVPQGEISEYVGHFKKNELLFVCAFPRYDKKVLKIAQHAKKVGVYVVALTDSTLSPICKYADAVLYAKNSSIFFLDSYTASLAVCNTIINEISYIGGDRVKANVEKMEQCLAEFNDYNEWKT
ncbi:MAG: SIS domain-containing protein, partial [Sedimentibacter sp.]